MKGHRKRPRALCARNAGCESVSTQGRSSCCSKSTATTPSTSGSDGSSVFLALIGFNEIARRTKAGGITCFLVIPAILTAYFIAIYAGAAAGCRLGAQQPDVPVHEQLVPLREALRGNRRLHRLHDLEVPLGQAGQRRLVQVLPVRDRGHQHPDRRGQRLRKRRARVRHHVGVLAKASPCTAAGTTCSTA